jgi:hypothetical protein
MIDLQPSVAPTYRRLADLTMPARFTSEQFGATDPFPGSNSVKRRRTWQRNSLTLIKSLLIPGLTRFQQEDGMTPRGGRQRGASKPRTGRAYMPIQHRFGPSIGDEPGDETKHW